MSEKYQNYKDSILKSREKNKEAYQEYMREYMKDYMRKKRGISEEDLQIKNDKKIKDLEFKANKLGFKLVKI